MRGVLDVGCWRSWTWRLKFMGALAERIKCRRSGVPYLMLRI